MSKNETNKVLLDTFKLEDRLILAYDEILWRAADCAVRRAELYGWVDIETLFSTSNKIKGVNVYEFEIWGYEQENKCVEHFQTQCWICPKCLDDHGRDAKCSVTIGEEQ